MGESLMNRGRIQRYPYRRNNRAAWIGCATVILVSIAVCGLSLLLIVPSLLPRVGLSVAGFEEAGDTSSIFSQAQPMPTVQVQNPVQPAQVVIQAGDFGTFNVDASALDAVVGESPDGGQIGRVTFNESQLLDLCRQRTPVCGEGDGRVRNASIDLRPGGAVVNGDFYVPQVGLWQRAGIVLRLNSTTAQFDVAGVDVNGVLYNVPPGELRESVNRVAQLGNDLLDDVVVSAGGSSLQLREIYADDNFLTLILR
jgi:hypothetical protein